MTEPVPTAAAASAVTSPSPARKRWTAPALTRMDVIGAENTIQPIIIDGVISEGS